MATQIERGIGDGSLLQLPPDTLTQVIISTLVGVNRTVVLTPYAQSSLFEEALGFISRAIRVTPGGAKRPSDKGAVSTGGKG